MLAWHRAQQQAIAADKSIDLEIAIVPLTKDPGSAAENVRDALHSMSELPNDDG